MSFLSRSVLLVLALLLAACGGGGGDSGGGGGGSGNRAPTAVAGAGQVGVVGQLLTFNGSASSDPEGAAITYAWAIASAPAGNNASLAGATTASPTLRPDVNGTYTLSLTVSDGQLNSAVSTTTATVNVDSANQAAQVAARITATVSAETQITTLNWTDSFPAGTTYRIESRTGTASFATVETIVGLGGTNNTMQWTRPYTAPVSYRVLALVGGRELPLLSPAGQSVFNVAFDPAMVITLPFAEPIFGTVQASVSNAPAGSIATWYQNLTLLGTGNPYSWNTTTLPNGTRLLQAILEISSGTFVDLRKSVVVTNNPLAASATVSTSGNTARWSSIQARQQAYSLLLQL